MALTPLKSYPNCGTMPAVPPIPFPASLVATTGTWSSDLMPAGFGGIVFYATSDQAVTLTVTRYADLAGTILIDVSTQALVIATPGSVGTTDKVPYLSFVAAIANTTGSTANMTNMQILTGQFQ